MSRRARSRTIAALAAVALAATAEPVQAAPPAPTDLQVEGGEESWHPKRRFHVFWRNPDPTEGPAIAAVRYRLRNPDGSTAIEPTRIDRPARSIESVEVPGPPGVYALEIQLEGAAGEIGPVGTVRLRFDDRRPGTVEPIATPTWLGRAAFPLRLRLTHPAGFVPASGIRGYAVSVAPSPGREPCEAADRCTAAETDLRGGVADDVYRVADLPPGLTEVRVVAVSGSGMASTPPGRALLRVDEVGPTVELHGAPNGWTSRPVSLLATAADESSGMNAAEGGVTPFTAIAIDDQAPTVSPGAVASALVVAEGAHRVSYYARDLAGNVDDGGRSNGFANPPAASALVRIDRRPPVVSFVSSRDSGDPELIRVRVADAMSGADPARGWIGVRRAGSGDRFVALPRVTPGRASELRGRWDSDSFAAGEYQLRAVAYDRAGNATASSLRADGTQMRLTNPLKAKTVLRAGFRDRDGEGKRTIRFGEGLTIEGSLETAAGTPLPGQPVRIVESGPSGGPLTGASAATTGRGGTFAFRIAPGPSREIAVVFPGTQALTRSASRALSLAVRSAVSLRASSPVGRVGGPPVVFSGRVRAAAGTLPAEGKAVQLQFRLPGLPWSEFRTVQTDRRGRFRYAYRFSDDDSRGVRFRFRAYAPAQAGWPYEPAGSRSVVVRGR